MNRRYLLLLVAVCLLVGCVQAWGEDFGAWDYRKEITVNNTGSNLTNYQVLFTVNRSAGSDSGFTVYLDGKCESDYDDIRFTTSDENTLCDYWIESNSSTVANIWVEIPSIPNSTAYGSTKAYLYYGNTGASAASNGTNTFPLFDDFLGSSINSTKWASYTGTGSTIVVSGGVITFTTVSGSGDRYAGIKSSDTFGVGYCVNTRQKSGDAGNRAYKYSTFGHGSDREAGMTLGAAMSITDGIIFRDRSSSNANWYARRFSGTSLINESMLDVTTSTDYKIYEIARTEVGAVSTWFIDGVSKYTSGGTAITSSIPVTYGIDNMASSSGVDAVDYVDWIFVRKYATDAPTVSAWGIEEIFPGFWASLTAQVGGASPPSWGGYAPLLVTFFDNSTAENCTVDNWYWDLGDGYTSNSQNPQHQYTSSGCYFVYLTVYNTSYNISDSIYSGGEGGYYLYCVDENTDIPNADFTVTETCGDVGDTFYFIDFSTGGGLYAWNWSFGDGSYSELRNPTHQYASNGTYDVGLTVWGAYGNDTLTRSNLITIPCGAPTPTPTGTTIPTTGPVYTGTIPGKPIVTGTVIPTATTDEYNNWSWSKTGGFLLDIKNDLLPELFSGVVGFVPFLVIIIGFGIVVVLVEGWIRSMR